jgi:hypothetical protein
LREAVFFREVERLDDFRLLDLRLVDFLLGDLRLLDFRLLDFLLEDFLVADFRVLDFLLADFFLADFFEGTFAPASRASDKPIAIACFLLFTVLPEPPLFNLPRLRSCMARFTFSPAFLPYFAIALSIELKFESMNPVQQAQE